jgi:LysM repeat protein
MNHKNHGATLAATLLLAAIVLSACQQSVSNAPLTTPTAITPTGLFVTPLTSENPMQMIEEFAQGTAAAQTAAAGGGTPTTPQAIDLTGTVLTPETGITGTASGASTLAVATTAVVPGTQVTAAATTAVPTTAVAGTPPTSGPKPTSYTLQKGEFPYCIARRFNINPDELLSLNGLTNGQIYYPDLTLKIPQTNNPFPSDRSLHTHPTTYTVPSADTTVYGVACYFGDVDPAAIAAKNGIAVSAALTSGQQLSIP